MGLCHGKELYEPPTKDEIQRNKEINIIIKKEKQQIKKESANTNKILLLGILILLFHIIIKYQ